MAEQNASATAAAGPPPKKSKTTFLFIGLAAVLLLGGSGAAWFLHARGQQPPPAAAAKKEPQYTVHLEPFTVNLADLEESHFLRVTIDLGLAHAPKEEGKEGTEGGGFPVARTRDTLLSVLSACKADDLLTPEGKAQLKHHLLAALQAQVPEIETQDIYFTEFLVQR
jgi:flagellar protein FliL